MRNLNKLNDNEIKMGTVSTKNSWHNQYRESAWIFFGGMSFDLTEGDIICIFSQYGEIVNINLIRDQKTGKSKGYGFICYEDQRSTDLAVDNFNGAQILGRFIRVDHVLNYRMPKDTEDMDEITKMLREEGCSTTAAESIKAKAKETKKLTELKAEKDKDHHQQHHDRNYRNRDRKDQQERDSSSSYKGRYSDR